MNSVIHELDDYTHKTAKCRCGYTAYSAKDFDALREVSRHIREPQVPLIRLDSPEQKPFTAEELFSEYEPILIPGAVLHICKECGAAVGGPEEHVNWHNKVADL